MKFSKKYTYRLIFISLFILGLSLTSATRSFSQNQVKAFPTAEGFGKNADGGRGGKIYIVTSLADTNTPGTLRYGIQNVSGPRTIVFRVGGIIYLSKALAIEDPDITIFGQTAPGDGIYLYGATFKTRAENVIIRGVRFFLGDGLGAGIDAYSTGGNPMSDVILDHCTIGWGTDENMGMNGGGGDITDWTIQHCMIMEGLNFKNHGYGSLFNSVGRSGRVQIRRGSFLNNMVANCAARYPLLGGTGTNKEIEVVNNILFNYRGVATGVLGDSTTAWIQGNLYKPSIDIKNDGQNIWISNTSNPGTNAKVYQTDNLNTVKGAASVSGLTSSFVGSMPFKSSGYKATSASKLGASTVLTRGAIPHHPDIETRTYNHYVKNDGGIIDRQSDVGGVPKNSFKGGTPPQDSDGDGIPDTWEDANGTNKNSASDGNQDVDGDGYTNVEEWANEIYGEYTTTSNVNTPPVVTNPGTQNYFEGSTVNLQIEATDNPGDILTFSESGLPSALSLDSNTGLISGTLDVSANTYPVTLTVRDQENLEGTISFDIVVNDGSPVVVNPIADASVVLNSGNLVVDLSNVFDDNNGVGNLTYSVEGVTNNTLVTNTSINSGSLTVSFATDELGSAEIRIRATDAGSLFIEDIFTVTTVVPIQDIVMEAECGTVGSDWNAVSQSGASGGVYMVSSLQSATSAPGSSGIIVYDFNVTNAGNYSLYARVKTPTEADNSFWVRVNGGSWIKWGVPVNSQFTWREVQNSPFTLSNGSNTIEIGYRESGSQLDKLQIVQAGNASPTGMGNTSPSCGNTVPIISTLSDVSIDQDTSTGSLQFTVSDGESSASALTVTVSNDNNTLLPTGAIVVSGNDTDRSMVITPASGETGTAQITVKVSDGDLESSTSFDLTVNATTTGNTAPVISTLSDVSIDQDTSTGSLQFTVSDGESSASALTVTVSNDNNTLLPTGAIVVSGNDTDRSMVITPASGETGTAQITVKVSDGDLESSTSFDLTVNAVTTGNTAPVISTLSDVSIDQDTSTGSLQFTVSDGESSASALTVTVSNDNNTLLPTGAIVVSGNDTDRSMVITPASGETGTAQITVKVSDGDLESSTSFDLTVNATTTGNTAPVISTLSDVSIDQDTSTGSLQFTVSDGESSASALTVTVSNDNNTLLPTGAIVVSGNDTDRSMVITPASGETGTAQITVKVSDGDLESSTSFDLTVNATTTGNTAPVISTLSDVSIDQDTSTGSLQFTVSDGESSASALTVTVSNDNNTLLPTGAIVVSGNDTDRSMVITPASGETGTAQITVKVSDGDLESSTSFDLTVNAVTTGNTAPVISTLSDVSIDQDTSTGSLQFTVSDGESSASALTVTVSNDNNTLLPTGAIVVSGNDTDRSMVITPASGETGTAQITVKVSDGDLESSTSFDLTVNATTTGNTAPVISTLSDVSIDQDTSTGSLQFTVSDGESSASALTVTVSNDNNTLLPTGAIVVSGNDTDRSMVITPASGETGTAQITVKVSDGDLESSTSFDLTVNAVTTGNTAPVISTLSDVSIDQDTSTGSLQFTVSDGESSASALTVTVSNDNNTLLPTGAIVVSGNDTDRSMVITPASGETGTAQITVKVSDGDLESSTSFDLTVNATTTGNTAPVISTLSDVSIDQDTSTGSLQFTVSDGESSASALTVTVSNDNNTLLPTGAIVVSGNDTDRSMVITPASGETGTAQITVKVSDGDLESSTSFDLTVNAVITNKSPQINQISDFISDQDLIIGPIGVIVSDEETPAKDLELTISSSNQQLVSNQNLVIGGKDSNRELLITPESGKTGTTTITITVSDGINTSKVSFNVIINEVIPQLGKLTITGTVQNTICNAANGSIKTFISGGAPPYSYRWSNGILSKNISALEAGTYILEVEDSQGELVTQVFDVSLTNSEILLEAVLKSANCSDQGGSITVTASGGSGPYTFEWNIGGRRSSVNGLSSGEYDLVVKDANGCQAKASYLIEIAPSEMQFDLDVDIISASCQGTDGSITLNIEDGTAPYNVQWSNGEVGTVITNLVPDNYTAFIEDANGCYISKTFSVNQEPGPAKPTISQQGDSLWIEVNSDIYQWFFNNQLIADANEAGLLATQVGDYSVSVYDENGCVSTSDFYPVTEILFESNGRSNIQSLNIYPVPVVQDLTMDLSLLNPVPVTVSFYSQQGVVVLQFEEGINSSLTRKYNLSSIPRGLFFLKVKAGNEIVVKKFLKF